MVVIITSIIFGGLIVEGFTGGKKNVTINGIIQAWILFSILTYGFLYVFWTIMTLEFKIILYLIDFL